MCSIGNPIVVVLQHHQKGKLCEFEEILLTLFYTNTIHSYSVIGNLFGIDDRGTVRFCIDKWLPLLAEIGDMMSDL